MKFKIVKHFSLSFLGDEWKDAYIDFKPFSITDVKEKLPQIAKLQEKDADFGQGMDTLLNLLGEKFISGKGINEEGVLVDISKEDLKDLPIDVVGGAFSFLSDSEMKNSTKPSLT